MIRFTDASADRRPAAPVRYDAARIPLVEPPVEKGSDVPFEKSKRGRQTKTRGFVLEYGCFKMAVTYYVAMPFDRNEEGELVVGEAQDRSTASAAENLARRMAEIAAGAVAFSRTGDPAVGEFEDAVVLRQFGEVPKLENLAGGD